MRFDDYIEKSPDNIPADMARKDWQVIAMPGTEVSHFLSFKNSGPCANDYSNLNPLNI